MRTEKIVCNICDTDKYEKRMYKINSGFLVKCSNCGLFYANPRRMDIIKEVLEDKTKKERTSGKKLNLKGRLYEFNAVLDRIQAVKPQGGRILDVGCYDGIFLNEARKRKWDCHGVEPHIGGARYAREELKLDVQQCVLEKCSFKDKSFDAVTLLATLEHHPNPLKTLKEAKRFLKPDGLLVISVPTIPFYLNLVRSRWRMFIGDHYTFFTDDSMKRLLGKSGYKLLSAGYVTKSVDMETISARISSDWQPYNIGPLGRFFRKFVEVSRLGGVRFTVNPYDMKIYLAQI